MAAFQPIEILLADGGELTVDQTPEGRFLVQVWPYDDGKGEVLIAVYQAEYGTLEEAEADAANWRKWED